MNIGNLSKFTWYTYIFLEFTERIFAWNDFNQI